MILDLKIQNLLGSQSNQSPYSIHLDIRLWPPSCKSSLLNFVPLNLSNEAGAQYRGLGRTVDRQEFWQSVFIGLVFSDLIAIIFVLLIIICSLGQLLNMMHMNRMMSKNY